MWSEIEHSEESTRGSRSMRSLIAFAPPPTRSSSISGEATSVRRRHPRLPGRLQPEGRVTRGHASCATPRATSRTRALFPDRQDPQLSGGLGRPGPGPLLFVPPQEKRRDRPCRGEGATIVCGEIAGPDAAWLDRLYIEGRRPYLDVVAFRPDGRKDLAPQREQVQAVMFDRDASAKLWIESVPVAGTGRTGGTSCASS